MSKRQHRKILQYIDDDDLGKLKSYVKKHKKSVSLDEALDDEGNTALHIACKCGHDVIVSFLLKKGASVWITNKTGDLPLHEACFYATCTGRRHVYEDLIVPLLRSDPSTLDRDNGQGFTPRMMLKDWEAQLPKPGSNYQFDTQPSRENTSDSSSDEEKESWSEKLARAMDEDYGGNMGDYEHYEDDHSYETEFEAYEDWSDRMYNEHRYRHQPRYSNNRSSSSHKRRAADNTDTGPKRPRISEEKRREFERKQKLIAQEEMNKRARREQETLRKTKADYETSCDRIFRKETTDVLYTYADIPWPEVPGKGMESMLDLLFCDLNKSEPDYRKYLREQVVRWHPDRFQQRLTNKIHPKSIDKILEKVNTISQVLNQHSDSL